MNAQGNSALRKSDRGHVHSVKKAMEILIILAEHGGEASVTELGQELHTSSSTAHRLLASLCQAGVVEQNGQTARYRLGWRIVQLAQAKLDSVDLISAAAPALKRLWRTTRETAGLFMPVPEGCLCVQQLQSPQQVRSVSRIGEVFPKRRGAVGRALLEVPRASIEVETTLGEVNEDTYALAAPVIDCVGKVHAAVTLAVPPQRWSDEKVAAWATAIRAAAEEISRHLGWAARGAEL